VKDMAIVFALSEMRLSLDTKEGVSVDDFIRGVVDTLGDDVVLLGGNSFPNDIAVGDKGGLQFYGDEVLEGHVVAMGIGGPINVHSNHTNEFEVSDQAVTVTKAEDTWILELDGRPATEVYREIRGMAAEDEFTSDWQHPIGVIVDEAADKVYLRMVLNEDAERKALEFVAPIPEGTKIKILKGGDDASAILASAKEGITESIAAATGEIPVVALLSNCCARGMRLREFREGEECEIQGAILQGMGEMPFPIFGFYAWGELGPIAGEFDGLRCMYQQHTFVSTVLTEKPADSEDATAPIEQPPVEETQPPVEETPAPVEAIPEQVQPDPPPTEETPEPVGETTASAGAIPAPANIPTAPLETAPAPIEISPDPVSETPEATE